MASLVAVDTNLLVRLVTNDDPEGAAAAVDGGERLIGAVRRLGLEPPVQAP